MKAIFILLVALSGCYTSKERGDRGTSESTGCLPRKLDSNERCDITTNCKYEGKCRKVADVQRHGTTVRFVVPHVKLLPFTSNRTEQVGNVGVSMLQRMREHGYSWGSEECVCDFTCTRGRNLFSETNSVCGSNGRTYQSECHLRQEACRCQLNVEVHHTGTCERDADFQDEINVKTTPALSKLVVGDCANGCNYGATCDMNTRTCICDIKCSTQPISHVCGRDRNTYGNICHVKQAQCMYQKGIDILYRGQCRDDERPRGERKPDQPILSSCDNLDCDATIDDPVCGTDDISYPNECVLKLASCIKEIRIKVKHKKLCDHRAPTAASITTEFSRINSAQEDKNDPCHGISCHHGGVCIEHEQYEFICSCDVICNEAPPGLVKPSSPAISLDVEIVSLDTEEGVKSAWAEDREESSRGRNRRRRRKHRASHRRRSRERSRRSIDGPRPLIYDVLCGTDNKTYANECQLKKEACHTQMGITIAHNGACVKPIFLPTILSLTSTQVDGAAEFRDETINASSVGTILINKRQPSTGKDKQNDTLQNRKEDRKKPFDTVGQDSRVQNDDRQFSETREEVIDFISIIPTDELATANKSDNSSLEVLGSVSNILKDPGNTFLEQRDEVVDSSFVTFARGEDKKDLGWNHNSSLSSLDANPAEWPGMDNGTATLRGMGPKEKDENEHKTGLHNIEDKDEIGDIEYNHTFGHETVNPLLQVPSLLWVDTTTEEGVGIENITTESNAKQKISNVTSKQIVKLFKEKILKHRTPAARNPRQDSLKFSSNGPETPSDAIEGGSVVALVLGILFGQLIIVAALVSILLYMKKRKKIKELPEAQPNLSPGKINDKENIKERVKQLNGVCTTGA